MTAEADSPQVRLKTAHRQSPPRSRRSLPRATRRNPLSKSVLKTAQRQTPAESSQDLSVARSPAEVTESVAEVAHAEALEQDAAAEEAPEAVPANDTAVTEVAEDGSATSPMTSRLSQCARGRSRR